METWITAMARKASRPFIERSPAGFLLTDHDVAAVFAAWGHLGLRKKPAP